MVKTDGNTQNDHQHDEATPPPSLSQLMPLELSHPAEVDSSNGTTNIDREAKRAQVKAEAAQADSIDIDSEEEDFLPTPEAEAGVANVGGGAPHQGVHGPHGPVTQFPAPLAVDNGFGQVVLNETIVNNYYYLPGYEELEYGIEIEPLPTDIDIPITPNEARTRLDEMHFILTLIASTKDKAQAEAISFKEAAPNVGWVESMDGHVRRTLERFGGGEATTNLYRHVEKMAKLAREALQEVKEEEAATAGQGGGEGGGQDTNVA